GIEFAAEDLHEFRLRQRAAVGKVQHVELVPVFQHAVALLLDGLQDRTKLVEFRVPQQVKIAWSPAGQGNRRRWVGICLHSLGFRGTGSKGVKPLKTALS